MFAKLAKHWLAGLTPALASLSIAATAVLSLVLDGPTKVIWS